jgi:hypothetical protein
MIKSETLYRVKEEDLKRESIEVGTGGTFYNHKE